jgi:hypothetical protein
LAPRLREAVVYQLAITRTWFMIAAAALVPLILYIAGLSVFENEQTPFVSVSFVFTLALSVIALINGIQVWRARRI